VSQIPAGITTSPPPAVAHAEIVFAMAQYYGFAVTDGAVIHYIEFLSGKEGGGISGTEWRFDLLRRRSAEARKNGNAQMNSKARIRKPCVEEVFMRSARFYVAK
jgi:hypothetical protein